MGTAAVFMKVHRTRSLPVSAELANFGYRVLLPDATGQTAAIVRQLDTMLVQARRKAQIIAWHNGADDLHVLQQLPRAAREPRHPGVNAVADAWKNRASRDPSTARCVDTSHDLGPAGLISDTAAAHGLKALKSFAGGQQQASAQQACEALAEERTEDFSADALAGSVLSSAATTALLGGKHAGQLHWDEPLSIFDVLAQVAWEAAPSLLGGVPQARNE
ncbi:hypothetical protein [Streptomyces sp. PSKA30]|uniref:hypothetical protein n=1 Tax=Streptomyces sp. PSKA30 TaxID=2874597 RepID=UPI001CD0C9DE|nr:hypothetical protein [Streptomyces sp. PSKA30]MBZ9645292.1 hypothetical protein [Streptomyces sp. PSKA30]